jgi:site-specific recombinase XerD
MAGSGKLHLRNVLHVLFECAARWELIKENPITRVRQGGARRAEPDVLTPEEFRALLAELTTQPYRMMVQRATRCGALPRWESQDAGS